MVGGLLVLPATADTIESFLALAEAAPEELSTIANVMPAPPLPFLAEEHHGTLVIFAMLVYSGDAAAGLRAVAPFRAIAAPLVDLLGPMSYPEVYPPEDPSYHPIGSARTIFVDAIDRRSVQTIVATLTARMPAFGVSQIRVLGGAMARVPADATAFAHRGGHAMISVATLYEHQAEAPTHEAWSNGSRQTCAAAPMARTSASSPPTDQGGSAPPIPARPGIGLSRSSAGTTRATSST